MKNKKAKPQSPNPCFPLKEVKKLLQTNQYVIAKKAIESARNDFNWNTTDIVDALLKLKKRHHYKRSVLYKKSDVMMDIYKASINGQYIYLHYYIDDNDNLLIIGSFKAV